MTIKKRFIALLAALVLMAAVAVVYVATQGGTHTDVMEYIDYSDITEDDLSVTVDNEDVATAERIFLNDNHRICVQYKAVNEGKAVAKVSIHMAGTFEDGESYDYTNSYDTALYVNSFGTVFVVGSLDFNGSLLIQYEILAALTLIVVVMGASFIESFRKAQFSYSMVAAGGVAVFCAFMALYAFVKMQWLNTFHNFLSNLLDSGTKFAVYTFPFVLGLSVVIAISNIWLIRHEGFRAQNMLGIALAVAWTLGVFGMDVVYSLIIRFSVFDIAWRVTGAVGLVLSFLECMLLSTIVCAFLASKYKPLYNKDYLLILGCCIRDDGTLTPILRGRADAAIQFEKEQFAATGKHAKFVPSGGQGADEVISEAEAIKRYLMEQGYPEEQIVKEDKSVNTFQNIQFSRDRIKEDAGTLENIKAAFATTNYHIFRGYVLSKKHGLDAQGISAKTKWYFFPNAFLREFAGLLAEKKIRIALFVALMLLAYVAGSTMLEIGGVYGL